jgi:microcystin-dependent protein
MAISQTTRLSLWRWSSNDDPLTRDQMTDSHQNLEDLAARFTSGLASARPAAADSNARGFYLATDTNVLSYSDGSAWHNVNAFATPTGMVPGDVNTAGSSTSIVRADHKHSLPAWGAAGNLQPVGTSASEGSNNTFARIDHRHILDGGSVTAGKIGVGGISAPNQFAAQVVDTAALKDNHVTRGKIETTQRIPVGSIMAFAGTNTAPDGWRFCDGSPVSTTDFPTLFGIIGYQYGGSGGTFFLPNLCDRIPRGAVNTTTAVGLTAGENSVTLSANQIPEHTHNAGTIAVTNGEHTHSVNGYTYMSAVDMNHRHTISHTHTGTLTSNVVGGGTGFGTSFLSPGPGSGAHASGQAPNGGQYDIVTRAPVVNNTAISTNTQSTSNSGFTNLTEHVHPFEANCFANTAYASTVSGATAANITTGSTVDIRPKTLTVNYIIKT